MIKAIKRPHRLAFRRKWWQLIILMLAFISAEAQDSAKYAPINGYGFRYKRHVVDSVMLVPLYESPHLPYRAGAIKYRKSDSSFYKYTGTQWLKVQEGGAATNGIDTVYTVGDTVQVIETPDETYFTLINTPYTEVINDSTVVIGNDTLLIRGTGGSGGSAGNTNIGSGFRILIPSTQELKTLFPGYAALIDSTTNTNGLTIGVDSSTLSAYYLRRKDSALYATQHDLITTPTLQTVTTAGNTTTDSVKIKTLTVDSSLYAPVRRALDTIMTATRRGDIRFDTTTNSMMYRDNNFWTYFATLSNSLIPNRPNMRLIAGVIRPTVSGSTVTWNWIINASHDSIGFAAPDCDGSSINLNLTTAATKIHTIIAVPDETLAQYVDVGVSFQTTKALLYLKKRIGVISGYFQGNGTTYVWTGTSNFTSTYNTANGQLNFDFNADYTPVSNGTAVRYAGLNGYFCKRLFAGLSGNDRGYQVTDEFGNGVVGAPTTTDVIEVVVPEQTKPTTINPCVASGDGWASFVFGGGLANIWVIGLIEY